MIKRLQILIFSLNSFPNCSLKIKKSYTKDFLIQISLLLLCTLGTLILPEQSRAQSLPISPTSTFFFQNTPWRAPQLPTAMLLCGNDTLHEDELSIEAIEQFLDEHTHIRSVNQLLTCLPKSFIEKAVVMYESRAPENASIAFPRIIHFTEDGEFVLTYTGNPIEDEYNQLPMMQYDENENRYRFLILEFLSGTQWIRYEEPSFERPERLFEEAQAPAPVKVKPSFHIKEPDHCTNCHQGKPVWESYRTWTGAYGSQSDKSWEEPNENEYQNFVSFLSEAQDSPRYKFWIDEHLKKDPFEEHQELPIEDFNERYPLTPENFPFNNALGKSNAKRIMGLLQSSEHYEELKYLTAATLLRCDFPEEVHQVFQRKALDDFGEDRRFNLPEIDIDILGYATRLHEAVPFELNTRSIAQMYILSEWFGVDSSEWDTRFFPDAALSWQYSGPGMLLGIERSMDPMFQFMVEDLDATQELIELLESIDWTLETLNMESRQFGPEPIFTDLCEALSEPLIESIPHWENEP